jgi:uncharacterized protein DUF3761
MSTSTSCLAGSRALGLAAMVAFGLPDLAAAQQPQQPSVPAGATARCRDGTYSFSRHRSGTCSHHGGVAAWLTPDSVRAPRPEEGDTVSPAQTGEGLTCGSTCGVERWTVKTLSDPDRDRVKLQPVDATIEGLVSLERPVLLPGAGRADSVEMTVYRVEARLLALFTEADGDYHLVLASPHDAAVTMIAEVPDPGCAGACASGFAEVYAKVRQKLMDRLNAPGGEARPLVRITGVGFFDYFHGQRGVAPNGIELHPVLDVEFP